MLMFLSVQYIRYIYLLYLMLKLFITVKLAFWLFPIKLIMKKSLKLKTLVDSELCQSSTLLFFFDNYCFLLLLQMELIILLTRHFTQFHSKRALLYVLFIQILSIYALYFLSLLCCQEEPSRLWYIES